MTKKVKKRLNKGVYGVLTGILFVVIGIIWLFPIQLLIDIQGFGLGSIVNVLPYVGYLCIIFGIFWFVINALKLSRGQLTVVDKTPKKNVDVSAVVNETSSFEKKHIKGIVFDLDGTLLDTLEDLADAGNTVLKNHQFPVKSLVDYKNGLGNGLKRLMESLVPTGLSNEEIGAITLEMIDVYEQNYNHKTQSYPGVLGMLNDLNRRGYLLAVVSNKKDKFAKALIKEHFPEIPFVEVIGEHPDIPKKPDPTSLQYIASLMMLDPSELVMIGDSEVDVSTANNVGCLSISVDWGFRSIDLLRKTNTDYIISYPSELVLMMDEINRKDEFEIKSKH